MYVQDIGGWGTVGNRRGNAFKKKKRPGEDLVASPFKKSKTHGDIHVQMVCVLCLYPSKVHSRKKNKKNSLLFSPICENFRSRYIREHCLLLGSLGFYFYFIFFLNLCVSPSLVAELRQQKQNYNMS